MALTTIREMFRFVEQLEEKVDLNQTCFEPSIIANRWLSIRLQMLGNLIILFAALFAVLGRDTLEPGNLTCL
jgi:ATP-binding cassette, subfamily C (CFTR/MRP), member 1